MDQDFSRVNSKEMDKLNKSKVLKLIFEGKVLSRGDIIKQTSLTAPSVSRLVKSLISEEGLVKHSGIGHSSGGRPLLFYDFNGSGRYIIGIDVGATYIRAILSNLVKLLYPEMILIRDGVSLNGEIFFNKLALLMEGKLMPTKANTNIVSVTFSENSTIMGALTLVLHKVLNFGLIN